MNSTAQGIIDALKQKQAARQASLVPPTGGPGNVPPTSRARPLPTERPKRTVTIQGSNQIPFSYLDRLVLACPELAASFLMNRMRIKTGYWAVVEWCGDNIEHFMCDDENCIIMFQSAADKMKCHLAMSDKIIE